MSAADFDPPLSWDPDDPGWVPTSGYPFDDGSSPTLTEHDFDRAATDLDLHRRAAARCTVSEPHRDADEDVPCSGCLLAAARQLAIASQLSAPASIVTGGPAAIGAIDGAAGRVPRRSAAAPPSVESNRRESELPAAEGATAIARTEGTA